MLDILTFVLLGWSLFAALILVPFGGLMDYAERKDEERKADRKEDDNAQRR